MDGMLSSVSSILEPATQAPIPSESSIEGQGQALEVSEGVTSQNPQEGVQSSNWRDTLPEHLKNENFFSRFDSVEKALESSLNAHKLVGKRIADIPPEQLKEMFTPEELAQYNAAKGIPESPEGYVIEGLPEHIEQMPQVQTAIKDFQGLAHKLGMDAGVAKELVKFEYALHQKAVEDINATNLATLSNTYGRELDVADKITTKAAEALGGKEFTDYLAKTGLAANPMIFNALYKVGKMMEGDTIPIGGDAKPLTTNTKESISQEIKSLYADPVFYKKFTQNDTEARQRMSELYQRLYDTQG